MKKIAVLLTILCASTLNGMEQPSYKFLPKELKQEIIQSMIVASKNLDETINSLKNLSTLHSVRFDKLFNNLKNFTAFMNLLAETFPGRTREEIAQNFNTQAAQQYLVLSNSFISNVLDFGQHHIDFYQYLKKNTPKTIFDNAYRLFEKDVDPNFSWECRMSYSPETYTSSFLSEACEKLYKKNDNMLLIIACLLNRGAKPNANLITYTESRAEHSPTDLNKKLRDLLKQTAEK